MTSHYCMQSPCLVCTKTWTTAGWTTISTSSVLPVTRRFYTWREALLTALASRPIIGIGKPRVERDLTGMWSVTTYESPTVGNATR